MGRVWFEPDLVVVHVRHRDHAGDRKRRFLARKGTALSVLGLLGAEYRRLEVTVEGNDVPLAHDTHGAPWSDAAELAAAIVRECIPQWAQDEERNPRIRA